MKQCIVCKKDFNAATRKQRFCSNSCRQKNYRKEVNEMIAEIKLKKAKIKPIIDISTVGDAIVPKVKDMPPNKPEAPSDLKGIDLAIWKANNLK
jgi:hypothetical protein